MSIINSKNIKSPIIIFTDHVINKTIAQSLYVSSKFSGLCHITKFNNIEIPFISYGYLRGTGELYKKSKDFWYVDHGYFSQSSRNFFGNKTIVNKLDGYFRIVHNDFWHSGLVNFDSSRFDKLNLNIIKQKSEGEYIIISEPTTDAMTYYNLQNWTQNTINEIKKYSNRKIITHNRNSKLHLKDLLINAWAFVSDHSSAGFLSMMQGVPAFFTNKTLKNIGDIKDIENHSIDYNILYNLAYGQWNLTEIRSGEAWDFLSQIYYKL